MKLLLVLVLASSLFAAIQASNPVECSLCQVVYRGVVGFINLEKPIEKRDLEKLCSHTGFFAALCVGFVDKFFDAGLADAENWESMDKLCVSQLHVCPSGKSLIEILGSRSSACGTCEMIVPVLKNVIEQIKPQCINLINKYSAIIFGDIAGYLNPSTFCPALGLCPDS